MLTDLYLAGNSPVHQVRPVIKIAALVALCTSLFAFEGWGSLLTSAALVAAGFALAGLKPRHAWHSLRPALWVLAAIFVVQLYLAGPPLAAFVVGRFAVLILAAALVTLTTTTSQFVDGIGAALKHTPEWVPKAKIALAISLCIRFIPMIRHVFAEVRQAQHARGLERNFLALLVPLVVRTLKSADEISLAIQSRSFD